MKQWKSWQAAADPRLTASWLIAQIALWADGGCSCTSSHQQLKVEKKKKKKRGVEEERGQTGLSRQIRRRAPHTVHVTARSTAITSHRPVVCEGLTPPLGV